MTMALQHSFLFIRHGETTWNKAKRAQGSLDTALNQTGRRQAAHAARLLRGVKIDKIVSSPLARVRDTAERIAQAQWLDVAYDSDLKEVCFGVFEGTAHAPWLDSYWSGAETPEGAEPAADFSQRVKRAVARHVDRPHVLVVAHGGVWHALTLDMEVSPRFWMANAQAVRVTPHSAERWMVEPVEDGADIGAAGRMI